MAERNTAIRGKQIKAEVAGLGLVKDSSDNFEVSLDEFSAAVVDPVNDSIAIIDSDDSNNTKKESIADFVDAIDGNGLSATTGVLAVEEDSTGGSNLATVIDVNANGVAVAVDETTIDANGSSQLEVVDEAITESKLAMNDSPANGEVIAWNTASGGYMEWVAPAAIGEEYIEESEIVQDDQSSNCNGATTVFTLANTPVTSSVQVFLNGLLQQEGAGNDYTLSGTSVTFTLAPETNDILIIHYIQD